MRITGTITIHADGLAISIPLEATGYRERRIIEELEQVEPYDAPASYRCYRLIAIDGSECVYDAARRVFVG